jgi:hypothetical protein
MQLTNNKINSLRALSLYNSHKQRRKRLLVLISLISVLFISYKSHALHLDLTGLEEIEEEPSRVKKVIKKLSEHHYNKARGVKDPRFPVRVEYKPELIALPEKYQLPKDFRVIDDKVVLSSLRSEVIFSLKKSEKENLVKFLSLSKVKIKWHDKNGHTGSGHTRKHDPLHMKKWDKSNACAALAFKFAVEGEMEVFAHLVALAPEAILPELQGHAMALIDSKLAAKILRQLMLELDFGNATRIARAAAQFSDTYLEYWAGKNIVNLQEYLSDLIEETDSHIHKAQDVFKEQRVGLLIGSLLAGSIKYVDRIKEKDAKRVMVVNVISNIAWAATTFMGVAPIASGVVALSAGGLSMAAVLTSAIFSELGMPRDFAPSLKEMQGHIEMSALESTLQKNSDCRLNILMTLSWMRAALHVNGLND